MLAVVYPHMCGLGGDLFLLHREARTGEVHCLNGTGRAPALATPAAFAERGLDAVPARGPLSLTVPGTVGAWEAALDQLRVALARRDPRSRDRAREGRVSRSRRGSRAGSRRRATTSRPTRRCAAWFLDAAGAPVAAGTVVRLPDLAATLSRLADAGAADLYAGELAQRLGGAVEAAGGLLSAEDLRRLPPGLDRAGRDPPRRARRAHDPAQQPGRHGAPDAAPDARHRTGRGRSTTSTTSSPRSSTPSPCATPT